ncbi:hypothetical protein M422DRAFT_52783 [Sphaerobolus stellatus SS14]|uniref:Uncharacterized protein n=1 Tax=Sphaerobolus stellatus (strain SS14) TaxID=990650 RepID=A0A0C9UTU0_SPHS4|nr:hypothetical protein M422DRAFT_52783 [Sphaerobolus stellatus SS14]
MANTKEPTVQEGPIPPSPPRIFSSERTVENRMNDGSDEFNPFDSPTLSAPAVFKARLGLITPYTAEAVNKTNSLTRLHFKKKGRPQKDMSETTSHPAGHTAPNTPGLTPPSRPQGGDDPGQIAALTTKNNNTGDGGHAKDDEDHSMDPDHNHASITTQAG